MTSRVLYLSENITVTVQKCLVFSIIRLNGATKKTDYGNRMRYSQSLYEVSIGNHGYLSETLLGFDHE